MFSQQRVELKTCVFVGQLLCDPVTRAAHGHDVVIILALLVNYRKHEATNPYIVKLSILDDELALNGYGQVSWRCSKFSLTLRVYCTNT